MEFQEYICSKFLRPKLEKPANMDKNNDEDEICISKNNIKLHNLSTGKGSTMERRGSAGMSAAKQVANKKDRNRQEVRVCVIEKAVEIGEDIFSGTCFDPVALDKLISNWKKKGALFTTPVTADKFGYLTKNYEIQIPIFKGWSIDNQGNLVRLGTVVKWLGE